MMESTDASSIGRRPLRIGIVGLDASHAPTFTRLLNGSDGQTPIAFDARVVAAWPGEPSADFAPSRDRADEVLAAMRDELEIPIFDSPDAFRQSVDAMIITGADPRTHGELFARVASPHKPVLVVKLLSSAVASAEAMIGRASRDSIPLLAASPHRFGTALVEQVTAYRTRALIRAADVLGRMPEEPPLPPLFWYGAHLVDLLYAALGPGCRQVTTVQAEHGADTVIVGAWRDGRIGTIRGIPTWPRNWQVDVQLDGGENLSCNLAPAGHSPHQGLLEQLIMMARTGRSPVSSTEMVEVVRFATAAERSRLTGTPVDL